LAEKCFYCDYDLEENNQQHFVSFHQGQEELEATLCHDCYQDWLEGIKG
jgi:hypothetical protein